MLKKIPLENSVSDKIEFRYSKKLGHHVIAKEDIEFGETIFVQKPTVAFLYWENFMNYCQNCFVP